ncbi:hypothetical protein V5O48_006823 [Marasmius crinis-equi]|uniref:Major facilitator superfamily (MFS) profile domain-containing protein n=1 Tax=Marasmius crinis-equi TaxID=585013 RepID=A0ABR3FIE0_9AGAR
MSIPTETSPLLSSERQTTSLARQYAKLILPTGIGIFLYAFDSTLIPATYAVIGSEFKQLERTGWIATSYMLMLASVQPLYGKLSDIFGRNSCLILAYGVYGLGCVVCGVSQNMSQLILGRALAGIGGAGLTTLVSILVADLVPLKAVGTWNGILNVIFVVGQTAGSPVGGALADGPGWRWAFIVQIPLLAAAAAIVLLLVPTNPMTPSQSIKEKLNRVDFTGAFCLVFAISTLLLGLDRAADVAWIDPFTIGLIVLAVILAILFWNVEAKIATEPFAPPHIMAHKNLLGCYFCDFFSIAADSCLIFFLPLYLQSVQEKSAVVAGISLVPAAIAATLGTLLGGWSVQRTATFKVPVLIGYLLQAFGSLLVVGVLTAPQTSVTGVVTAYAIASFGCGFGITTTVVAIVAHAGPSSKAIANAGAVIGILAGSTIIQNSLRWLLYRRLHTSDDIDDIVKGVRSSLDYIHTLPLDTQAVVRMAYHEAMFYAFVFAFALSLGAVLSAVGIANVSLSSEEPSSSEESP